MGDTFALHLPRTTPYYSGNTDKCLFLSSVPSYPLPCRAPMTVLTPQIVK